MQADRTTIDDALPLDGNAIAGEFAEYFAADVTTAVITCGGCGASAEIGAIRVYGGSMGTILRCARCDNVLLRFVHVRSGACLDLRGAKSLFFPRRV